MSEVMAGMIAAFFGFWFGYLAAHDEVSTECERIGGFYVGTKSYTCEVKP